MKYFFVYLLVRAFASCYVIETLRSNNAPEPTSKGFKFLFQKHLRKCQNLRHQAGTFENVMLMYSSFMRVYERVSFSTTSRPTYST